MKLQLIMLLLFMSSISMASECISQEKAIEIIKSELVYELDLNNTYENSIYLKLTEKGNIMFYGAQFVSSFENFETWQRFDVVLACNGSFTYTSGSYNGD